MWSPACRVPTWGYPYSGQVATCPYEKASVGWVPLRVDLRIDTSQSQTEFGVATRSQVESPDGR